MKRVISITLVIFLVLIVFSGFFWYYEVQYLPGRASVSQTTFSVENSYIFLSPLKAKANGQEKIRMTIFVLNNKGLGVLGRKVVLENIENLTVDTIQGLSDNVGKAVFDISSIEPGEFYINIKIDGAALPQKSRISFEQ